MLVKEVRHHRQFSIKWRDLLFSLFCFLLLLQEEGYLDLIKYFFRLHRVLQLCWNSEYDSGAGEPFFGIIEQWDYAVRPADWVVNVKELDFEVVGACSILEIDVGSQVKRLVFLLGVSGEESTVLPSETVDRSFVDREERKRSWVTSEVSEFQAVLA